MKKVLLLLVFLGLFFGCTKSEDLPPIEKVEEPAPEGEMEEIPLVEVDMSIFSSKVESTRSENGRLLEDSVDLSETTVNYFKHTKESIDRFTKEDDGKPLNIIDYGPVGKLPEEIQRPEVHILFSKPMVPLSKLGEPLKEFKHLEINPPLEGVYRWYGTSLLTFQADKPILSDSEGYSRSYEVRVKDTIQSLSGSSLEGDFTFNFYPKEVELVNLFIPTTDGEGSLGRTYNVPYELAYTPVVRFNMPVDPQSIKSGMEVKVAGSLVDFTLTRTREEGNRGKRSLQINISDKVSFGNKYVVEVVLKEGAVPRRGAPSKKENQSFKFETLEHFKYDWDTTYNYAAPALPEGNKYPLYIYFTQTVDPNQNFDELISTSLDLDSIGDYIHVYSNTIHLANLPVQSGDEYSVFIKGDLKDIYNQTLRGGDRKINVEVPEARAYIEFPDKSWGASRRTRVGYLEAQFDPGLIIQHQNINSLDYNVGREESLLLTSESLELNSVDLSSAKKNSANFEYIDLNPYMNDGGTGTVFFKGYSTLENYYSDKLESREDNLLVQVTDIGITVRYGYNKVIVWANSLTDGEPISGANVSLYNRNKSIKESKKSDKNGLVVFELDPGLFRREYYNQNRKSFWVSVESDRDRADLEVVNNQSPWRHGVNGRDPRYAEDKEDRILLFSDRQLYKPGEEISYRGIHWLQSLGDFEPYKGSYSLKLRSVGYNTDTIYQESGVTTESGGLFSTFTLPEDIKPGNYILDYRARDARGSATIKIANFRRLNFALSSKIPERTFFTGDTLTIPVSAYYLAGGGMPGADYSYYWTRKATQFTPKGERWKSYRFGLSSYTGEKTLDKGEGKLSGTGTTSLKQLATGHEKKAGTYRYVLETTVTDIDHQQISSTASALVHPASFYIGAKLGDSASYWSSFIKANEESTINIALVTPEGENFNNEIDIVAEVYKIEWKASHQQGVYDRVNVSYRKTEELIDTLTTKTDSKGLAKISYTPKSSGSYITRIKGVDKNGNETETELRFYSYGGGWYYWGGDNDSITLVPDRDLYFVGDKARIMVQSPLKEGKYLLTVEREGIVDESIIELDEDTTMIEVPIEEGYVPRIYVALSSYTNRDEVPDSFYAPDLGKPESLFGVAALNVSTETRGLEVEVVSGLESYRPGDEAEVFIKVTRDGKPVANAELIYLAVDRGVVDLVNYHVPNPLNYFYNPYNFPLYVTGDDIRNYLMDPVTYDISNLQGGDGVKLNERKDFNPLAAFEPNLITDAKGIAKVIFKLPDTLTTYRSTAIALNGNRIGYSEDEIQVKNPINVRTAFPRKLRYRDTGTGDVVVQNNTAQEQKVTLTLSSEDIQFPGVASKEVTVPPNSVYKVPFLMVPRSVGETEIKIVTNSEVLNEELTHKIEIERPIVKESFGTTGVVTDKSSEGILIPSNIADGFGSYDINLYASKFGMVKTPIRALKDTRRLNIISRIYFYIPDAILGESMDAIGVNYSKAGVERVLNELKSNQTSQGWISYWSGQRSQNLYMDIISLMFITGAKDRGIEVDSNLELDLKLEVFNQLKLREIKDDTTAFGAFVLNRAGVDPSSLVNQLINLDEGLGLTGLGYLTSTLTDLGRESDAKGVWSLAKKFVRLGTQTIDINEPYETRWYFDSEVRQISALILGGLKLGEPEELVSRYVRTLEDRINTGAWRSRTDYLWSLYALNEIAKNDNVENLDMEVKVVLENREVGSKKITALKDSTLDVNLPLFKDPLDKLKRDIVYPLTIEKIGVGNIYYSGNIEYGLPSEITQPRNEGISLFLTYETLDGEVVSPDSIEVGTTYRVRTVISSSKRRSYLTLDIPVPSGIEIVDPSFATTSAYKPDGGTDSEAWSRETTYGDEEEFYGEGYGYFDGYFGDFWWYWKNEPDQEIYDNHLTYSWETFYEGKRELTFLVRATNKGIFPTPPAQASLIYEPEVFGRTGGELFVIK